MRIGNAKPKIGLFVVSDRYLEIRSDFAMDIIDRIISKLKDNNIEVLANKKVIKGQKEAINEAIEMTGKDLDAYILYFPTWFESPTAVSIIRELEGLPAILWGFNMSVDENGDKNTTGSVVGELVLKGTLERMGYEFHFISGFPEEKEKLDDAIDYIYAARAKKLLRRSRFGQLGYTGIGMYPGTFDHVLMRRYIGPEVVPIPECEFDDYLKAVKDDDIAKKLKMIEAGFDLEKVNNINKLKSALRIYMAIKKVIDDYELDGINPRCHYDFSKRMRCTCCVPISLLSDEKIVTGCEGDIITSISMLIFYLLSNDIVTYGDIMDFDYDTNVVMFSACGFAPFKMAKNKKPALAELAYEGVGFEGILSSNVLKEETVTFGRLYEKKGDYGSIFGSGKGIKTELRGKLFPALNVKLKGKTEELIKNAPTQHMALVFGDITNRLNHFMKIMGIERKIIE